MDDVKRPNPLGGEGRYEADPRSNQQGLTPEEVFRSEVPQEGESPPEPAAKQSREQKKGEAP